MENVAPFRQTVILGRTGRGALRQIHFDISVEHSHSGIASLTVAEDESEELTLSFAIELESAVLHLHAVDSLPLHVLHIYVGG